MGRLGGVLGATWAVLGTSWAVLAHLGPSWGRLGPSWVRLGASWASGAILGPSKVVWGPSRHVSGCRGAFEAPAARAILSARRGRARVPGLSEASRRMWGPPSGQLSQSWNRLGPSWSHRGSIGPSSSARSPGCMDDLAPAAAPRASAWALGASRAILQPSWVHVGPSWSPPRPSGSHPGPPRAVLEPSRQQLRGRFCPRCVAA